MANEKPQPATADSQHYDRSKSMTATSSAHSDSEHVIYAPVPTRPRLPSRKSSGPLVIPRDSDDVVPVESDDVRAMSPRRTSKDIEAMGLEARETLREYVPLYPSTPSHPSLQVCTLMALLVC